MVFYNFRGDRAIEISRAFEEKNFDKFDRQRIPEVFYAGMMEYDGDLHIPKNYLVQPPVIDKTVSEYLCAEGITSFAISETQKFGHVTYFWNGNRSGYINKNLEIYIEIPSDKITFDKAPKMKADGIAHKTIELLKSGKYRWGRLNFPNGDMVGHTGIMDAAVIAVETVDKNIAKLLSVIDQTNGIAVITADHGNADEMFTIKNGEKLIKTSHTLNPVPFIIYDPRYKGEYEMAKIEIIRSLVLEIKKKFSKGEANKILDVIHDLENHPKKGKLLGTVGGIVIKELKYKNFRFYFIVDGFKLKIFKEEELVDLLLRFVRMSDKKHQQETINEIKHILRIIGTKGFS